MTTFDSTHGPMVSQIPLNFSASGDNVVVPGITGLRIKVLQFFFVLAGAVNLTYKSGAVTVLSGPMDFPSAGAQVQDFIQLPLTCNVSDPFVVNLSTGVQLGGTIWFIQS